jgi:hypothetical protein
MKKSDLGRVRAFFMSVASFSSWSWREMKRGYFEAAEMRRLAKQILYLQESPQAPHRFVFFNHFFAFLVPKVRCKPLQILCIHNTYNQRVTNPEICDNVIARKEPTCSTQNRSGRHMRGAAVVCCGLIDEPLHLQNTSGDKLGKCTVLCV